MKNFFKKFDENQKFNICIGDLINKFCGMTTKKEIIESLLDNMDKDTKAHLRNQTNLSIVLQVYIDLVIDTLHNVITHIQNSYHSENMSLYGKIINKFPNIISFNFDTEINNSYMGFVDISLPKGVISNQGVYKVFGDLQESDTLFISSQAIRRLKKLPFYNEFFKVVRKHFEEYPTLLVGIDFDDNDIFDMLEYIVKPISNRKEIYVVSDSSIISKNLQELISKYNFKLLEWSSDDFVKYMTGDETVGDNLQKKLVW